MSNNQTKIQNATTGGVAAEHPDAAPFQLNAGPSTSDEFNTAQLPLNVIACWAVGDVRFAFDSSFVQADCSGGGSTPEDIRVEMATLKQLTDAHPGCPLSVFGHADPVGSDVYNKSLSERRAGAVYALLIFQTDSGSALTIWKNIAATEQWGANQRGIMQQSTGLPAGTPDDTLMHDHMQKLCAPGPSLKTTDFLAQGADTSGKGDYQGCSEFNPVIIFSQEKQAKFDQAKLNNDQAGIADRNAQNAPNRRVLAFIFRKGAKVDPAKWPCPRASDGIAGCVARFWSDGETRRSTHLPDSVDRQFSDKQDTFACRFYQRLSNASPCEEPPPDPCTKKTFTDKRVDQKVSETISNAPEAYHKWNGTYGWQSTFTVSVDRANCGIKATIKIKVTGTITDAQKTGWSSAIETKWNNKVKFACPDTACAAACPSGYAVTVALEFVTTGEDYEVTANQPGAGGTEGLGGTNSMTGWGVDDHVDITHEFGHMLGNPEEYFTTDGTDYTYGGTKTGFRDADGGIMNNPANNPLPRNYESIRRTAQEILGTSVTCTISAV